MENKLPDDPFYVALSTIITPKFNKLLVIIVDLSSGQKDSYKSHFYHKKNSKYQNKHLHFVFSIQIRLLDFDSNKYPQVDSMLLSSKRTNICKSSIRQKTGYRSGIELTYIAFVSLASCAYNNSNLPFCMFLTHNISKKNSLLDPSDGCGKISPEIPNMFWRAFDPSQFAFSFDLIIKCSESACVCVDGTNR